MSRKGPEVGEGMLDLLEDFEKRYCLALSYFYVLKRFQIDNQFLFRN